MVQYEIRNQSIEMGCNHIFSFPPHLHAVTELLYVETGKIDVMDDGEGMTLEEGDLYVVFPHTVHEYIANGFCKTYYFLVNDSLLTNYKKRLTGYRSKHPVIRCNEEMKRCVGALYKMKEDGVDLDFAAAYLSLLMAHFFRKTELMEIKDLSNASWIYGLYTYIMQNYGKKMTLDELSAQAGVSKYHLSRAFKNHFGIGVCDYINLVRTENAAYLLSSTDKPITEIAFECGFDCPRTFNRIFKKVKRLTPREYRKM